jgi:maltose phosphorylase
MAKTADQYLLVDPWKIIEQGFHADRSRVSESLFSLANEQMGVRGYFDEGYSGDSLIGCYLNGIYEEHTLAEPTTYKGISNRICFMVNTADWLYTRIRVGDEVLDLHHSPFRDFRRELDFRTGELRRTFVWICSSGREIKIEFSRFLSMPSPELGFHRLALTPLNFSGPVSLTFGIDFSVPHETYRRNYWRCPKIAAQDRAWGILGISRTIGHTVFVGSRMLSEIPGNRSPLIEEKLVGCRLETELIRGQKTELDRVTALSTTRDPQSGAEETWTRGMATLEQTRDMRYGDALRSNAEYWKEFWTGADIAIEGDPETQQGIRFCIFQLQQTYRGAVQGANIGAKGLTGEAYNGNTFWDTETYCLPYFLFNQPQAARALIEFRWKTLPQALERAASLDCRGACFPVATIDGTESCTLWQHASLQIQPTTAVAYGIWHYVKTTGDADFLAGPGVELLIQISRFLASRGQWSPRGDRFGYYAVMGPDEFHMIVNNNCYTNYMAKRALLFTLETLEEMEPGVKAECLRRLGCPDDELAAWRRMADRMILPRSEELGIYEQHEGFLDLPHIDVDSIPVGDFPLYHHWSYDRIFRTDMIKQPDVLMFLFLYNQSFSPEEKRRNYEYYEPRCIHESSLSPSLHSIFAAELDRPQEAFDLFKFAARIDLDNYNRNTAEGIHLTSIAAAWMSVVYGYGGLRSDGEHLVLHPTIPPHWSSYRFQIAYRGSVLRVETTRTEIRLWLIRGEPIPVRIDGQLLKIDRKGLTLPMRGSPATGANAQP